MAGLGFATERGAHVMKLLVMLLVLLAATAACSPRALPLATNHPARRDTAPAPVAKRSQTLAPGVAGDVLANPAAPAPTEPPPGHHDHGGAQ